MASTSTKLLRMLIPFPNLFTATQSAFLLTAAIVLPVAGKWGAERSKKATEAAAKIKERSAMLKTDAQVRNTAAGKKEDEAAVAIAKTKAESAREAANAARAKAPHITQKAQSVRKEQVRERKTESKVKVVQENTKADIKVVEQKETSQISKVQARGQQGVIREKEKSKHAMEQQKTTHETIRTTNVKKHHDSMTDLNTKRADATQLAATSVEKNTAATNKVTQAVLRLKVASSAAHDSRLKLIKAMNEYDLALVNDNLTEDKEKALQVAYLENLPIERNLETQLAISKVNAESEDLQDIMVELAIGETSLNEALENCSPGTRAKLLKIHESEIPKEEALIVESPQKEVQSIEQRLAALEPEIAEVQTQKATAAESAQSAIKNLPRFDPAMSSLNRRLKQLQQPAKEENSEAAQHKWQTPS